MTECDVCDSNPTGYHDAGQQVPRTVRNGSQLASPHNGDPAHEAAAAAMAGLNLAPRPATSGGSHTAPPAVAAGAAAVNPADALKAAQAALSGIASQRPVPVRQAAAAAPVAVSSQWQQQRPPAPQQLPSPQLFGSPGQARNRCT